jgi:type II secretory pathway pseudopilin PulG
MSKYKKMMRQMDREQKKLDTMLGSRQAIIDPYAGVKDLSAMISNPFANLQVATKAAEMQARETDISLASTLDALRATGGGSATALAQAASRAKQGVSASIEQQEAKNAQLAAQGEQQAMQMRMQEAQRMQEADILGKTFTFQGQEQRDVADISRQSAMIQQTGQWAQDIKAANKAMIGSIVGGALSAVGSAAGGAGGFGKLFGG